MIIKELYALVDTVICDVKVEYGDTLKTQDYIYIVYCRVSDKLSDYELPFILVNEIASYIRKEVVKIEKKHK